MKFDWIDISIIASYIALSIFIGFWISKKAGKSLQNYFLGGNRLKWYYPGLSNGSGMFDVSGAAWTVTVFFVYGLKSVWIPWLWPVWNNSESFDRDMPIKFMPIKWEKLLMKLKAAERAGMEQTITFEFSHFMSPQSAYLQAGHLYNRYREYLQNLK